MNFRYSRRDPRQASREERLKRLARFFNELLLKASGDVERAMYWLKSLGERYGLFGEGMSLEDFQRWLEQQREARRGPGGWELTPRGERAIARQSLDVLFSAVDPGERGEHRSSDAGVGGERLGETRPWAFGDATSSLDYPASFKNALSRSAGLGLGSFELQEDDLEVHETEQSSACATVLLIDISHSMVLYGEDRITPARRVALALAELLRTRYPKDSLRVVTFGDEAREVPSASLPYLDVGPFHTNTKAGLALARDILRREPQGTRQIVMITDGKPSALTERNGVVYKNPFGLDGRIVARTLDEAHLCRRAGIPVTTFMLTDDPLLVGFVQEFTEANRGRVFYARADRLGGFLLVDFLRNRRRLVR
jgi:uncharacterized protein with von Willebrand factor type A (vWA) domain